MVDAPIDVSVAFDLLDDLVATFTAAVPLAVGEPVNVVDGDAVNNGLGTFLVVGWDDPDSPRSTSVSSSQPWAGIGGRVQDESGTVTCFVMRDVGDSRTKTARDAVRAVITAVKTILRADPTLGGRVPGLQWVRFGQRFELTQWLSEDGAVALCTFDIAFEARI